MTDPAQAHATLFGGTLFENMDTFNYLTEEGKRHLIVQRRRAAEKELSGLERSLQDGRSKLAVLRVAKNWFEDTLNSMRYEVPQSSKLHDLIGGLYDCRVYTGGEKETQKILWATHNVPMAQSFVIQHDWAGIFEKSDMLEGEIIPPANPAAFEFQISGRRVIVVIGEENAEWDGGLFLHTKDGWWLDMLTDINDVSIITDKIRGACIALDAEIAETSVVRAPHKLNAKREARGKLPLNDYHIVSLMRRSRVPPLASSDNDRRRPRLHFRRGHYRRHANHKTWIRWTLVGNPDLGFIDKEYRL